MIGVETVLSLVQFCGGILIAVGIFPIMALAMDQHTCGLTRHCFAFTKMVAVWYAIDPFLNPAPTFSLPGIFLCYTTAFYLHRYGARIRKLVLVDMQATCPRRMR